MSESLVNPHGARPHTVTRVAGLKSYLRYCRRRRRPTPSSGTTHLLLRARAIPKKLSLVTVYLINLYGPLATNYLLVYLDHQESGPLVALDQWQWTTTGLLARQAVVHDQPDAIGTVWPTVSGSRSTAVVK